MSEDQVRVPLTFVLEMKNLSLEALSLESMPYGVRSRFKAMAQITKEILDKPTPDQLDRFIGYDNQ